MLEEVLDKLPITFPVKLGDKKKMPVAPIIKKTAVAT